MSKRVLVAALAAFAFGCASGGGGSDLPPVQVYAAIDELPCEYEVIQTVSGSSSRASSSRSAFERIRADVLGQAGADVGADAVIAAEIDETVGVRRRGVTTSSGRVRYVDPPPARVYSGEAIRFISDTCRATEEEPEHGK